MILCWAYSSIDLSLVALSNLETTLSRTPPIITRIVAIPGHVDTVARVLIESWFHQPDPHV
jgi:hypothetical protein